MRKGRNAGRYEMAEDRFFNESSERYYLYDDMMDAAVEMIINSLGHSSSNVDDWSSLDSIVRTKRKKSAAVAGKKRALKCRVNKLLKMVTDEELAIFIDKYICTEENNIVGDFVYKKIEESLLRKMETFGLDEFFLAKNNFIINIISSMHDLKDIVYDSNYDKLNNIYKNKDYIIDFITFKEDVYFTIDRLSSDNYNFRRLFSRVIDKIRDNVWNIPYDMYEDYGCELDDMTIPKYCKFLRDTMKKYEWIYLLNDMDMWLCTAFSTGTMDVFYSLSPGDLVIGGVDVATILDKNLLIDLIVENFVNDRPKHSEEMYFVYDAINFAISGSEYTGCESGLIEDVYGISYDKSIISRATVKKLLLGTTLSDAVSNYLNKDNMPIIQYMDELYKIKKREYRISDNSKYFELMEILLNINPMYLISIKGKYDFKVFMDLFDCLYYIIQYNDKKTISYTVDCNIFIYASLMKYLNRYYQYDHVKELGIVNKIMHELAYNLNNDNYASVCVRIIYSFNTRNSYIINADLDIIKKYYGTNK